MANSNGKITAPVTHLDPYRVLSVSPKYGYDVGYICTHDNINMWSKKKPIRSSKPRPLTDQEFRDARHGMTIPTYVLYESMSASEVAKFDNGTINNKWIYTKPQDGDYKRLTDFENYAHYLSEGQIETAKVSISTGQSSITCKFTFHHVDDGFLTPSDIIPNGASVSLADMHIGVAIYHINDDNEGTLVYAMTSQNTPAFDNQGAIGTRMEFSIEALTYELDGTNLIIPFITNETITNVQEADNKTVWFAHNNVFTFGDFESYLVLIGGVDLISEYYTKPTGWSDIFIRVYDYETDGVPTDKFYEGFGFNGALIDFSENHSSITLSPSVALPQKYQENSIRSISIRNSNLTDSVFNINESDEKQYFHLLTAIDDADNQQHTLVWEIDADGTRRAKIYNAESGYTSDSWQIEIKWEIRFVGIILSNYDSADGTKLKMTLIYQKDEEGNGENWTDGYFDTIISGLKIPYVSYANSTVAPEISFGYNSNLVSFLPSVESRDKNFSMFVSITSDDISKV